MGKKETTDDYEAGEPFRKPRRRWLRILLILVVVLGILAWFAPSLIAMSPLFERIVAWATQDVDGTVRVGSASLGWLSPVVLNDVEVLDKQNQPVLRVGQLSGDRRLIDLALDATRLGVFRIEQAQANVSLRRDGTNVEDLLKTILSKPSSGKPLGVTIEVVDAAATIRDNRRGQSWTIEGLSVTAAIPADPALSLEVKAAGRVAQPAKPGTFQVEAVLPGDTKLPGKANFKAEAFPIEIAETVLARFSKVTQCVGRLTGQGTCSWNLSDPANRLTLDANLAVDEAVFGSEALMKADRIRLQRLNAGCAAAWSGEQLAVKRLKADCELGEINGSGTVAVGKFDPEKPADFLKQTYELSGRIDLARLGQMLPGVLQIRNDTRIKTGQLQGSLRSRTSADGADWTVRLETSDLTAAREGRDFTWKQPIAVSGEIALKPNGFVVKQLKCISEFLNIEGEGTLEQLTASGRFDLNQLVAQLEQFVDFQGVRLAGAGQGKLEWKQAAKDAYRAALTIDVREFAFTGPDHQPWLEPTLSVGVLAVAKTDFRTMPDFQEAALVVVTESDRIEAKLAGGKASAESLPLDVHAKGRLERWAPRLKPWVDLESWRAAGAYDVASKIVIRSDRISFDEAKLTVNDLSLTQGALFVREPAVEMHVRGTWDRAKGLLAVPDATLAASAVGLRASDVKATIAADSPFSLAGRLDYQGNVEGMLAWFQRPAVDNRWRVQGLMRGSADVQQAGKTLTATLDTTIDKFTLTPPQGSNQAPFVEPEVRFVAKAEYRADDGSLDIRQFDLGSSTVACKVTGKMADQGQRTVDLNGNLQYDLARLSEFLRPYTGTNLIFAGRGDAPLALRGPTDLAAIRGDTALGWSAGQAYGFRIGPAKTRATLASGVLRTEPIIADLNEGKLNLKPSLRLSPEPMELTIEPGMVAQNVRIDPTMCEGALRYAAPLLSGTTAAEGHFSVELDACRIVFSDFDRSEIAGRFTVHTMQIAAGPLVRELTQLMGLAAQASISKASVVPFYFRDGRIYHQNMELNFSGFAVRTNGSVGRDGSLAVNAEIPIMPRWLGETPLTPALRDQKISIPIAGTFDQPRLDTRAVGQITKQIVGKTAENLLQQGMQNGFQNIFNPQAKPGTGTTPAKPTTPQNTQPLNPLSPFFQ